MDTFARRGADSRGDAPLTFAAQGRFARPGSIASNATVRLAPAGFEVAVAGEPPVMAAYRDITTLMVGQGSLLLVLGDGPGAVRIVLEQLGQQLGGLTGELRERRTRQRLGDAFVQLDSDPIPVLEYRLGDQHGVAQLALHGWGAELVPLDDAIPATRIRRGAIGAVDADGASGTVRLAFPGGTLVLPGLGAAATRWAQRLATPRDAALRDAATLVEGLVPDAPFASRHLLSGLLVDGRPASTAALGAELARLDTAALTEPRFAASFRELLARAGGDGAIRWFAMAPERPGADTRKAWYLVALPGNLLALELVSEGSHATYLFRASPRATYAGEAPAAIADRHSEAASDVSNALIDARFLREPMALPAAQLGAARYLRYRLALAAIPSLAAARRRFVARLVHDDPARWAAALDDLVAWHATARDEAAEWPGRAAAEAAVTAAGADAGEGAEDAAIDAGTMIGPEPAVDPEVDPAVEPAEGAGPAPRRP